MTTAVGDLDEFLTAQTVVLEALGDLLVVLQHAQGTQASRGVDGRSRRRGRVAEDADVVGEVIAEDSAIGTCSRVKSGLATLGVYLVDRATQGRLIGSLIVGIALSVHAVEVGVVIAARGDLADQSPLVGVEVDMAVAVLLAEVGKA